MNEAVVEPSLTRTPSERWSVQRLWAFAAVLVAAQVGLIYWFGDKAPASPRQAANEPAVLWMPTYATEASALYNPTLFVWANPHGFSQAAWLEIKPLEYESADWTEPPQFLTNRVEQLGMVFREFVQKNAAPAFEIAGKSAPQIALPEPPATSLRIRSTVRAEGGLAGRRLLSQFDLPSWPSDDVLLDSVVQVIVDADGQTQSVTLLSGSGSKGADDAALDLAKSAEWEPMAGHGTAGSARGVSALGWGRLIFSWHTVPATNSPAANP